MLRHHNVTVFLEDLPAKYAAMLSPLAFRDQRALLLARHVSHTGRRLVLLHENGHLFQGTAQLGVTYDHDDWLGPAEQGADVFAAIGLLPTCNVDHVLDNHLWARDVEDELAILLMDSAEGIWCEERALRAAQNRLRVRHRLGV